MASGYLLGDTIQSNTVTTYFLFRPRHFGIDNAKLDRIQLSIFAWALARTQGLVLCPPLGNHPPSSLGEAALRPGLRRGNVKTELFLIPTSEGFRYSLANIHWLLDDRDTEVET